MIRMTGMCQACDGSLSIGLKSKAFGGCALLQTTKKNLAALWKWRLSESCEDNPILFSCHLAPHRRTRASTLHFPPVIPVQKRRCTGRLKHPHGCTHRRTRASTLPFPPVIPVQKRRCTGRLKHPHGCTRLQTARVFFTESRLLQ